MSKSCKGGHSASDLAAVLALVASSTIAITPARAQTFFPDWENARKSADIDALVLAWIASHVRGPLHRGRLN